MGLFCGPAGLGFFQLFRQLLQFFLLLSNFGFGGFNCFFQRLFNVRHEVFLQVMSA